LSWKVSRGMQYGQRKLHRSITEMRKSRRGLPSVSRGAEREPKGTTTSVVAIVNQGITTRGRALPCLLMGAGTGGSITSDKDG